MPHIQQSRENVVILFILERHIWFKSSGNKYTLKRHRIKNKLTEQKVKAAGAHESGKKKRDLCQSSLDFKG